MRSVSFVVSGLPLDSKDEGLLKDVFVGLEGRKELVEYGMDVVIFFFELRVPDMTPDAISSCIGHGDL